MKESEHAILHAGTPEVMVAGNAGPCRAVRFLRIPNGDDLSAPARILVSRTVTDVPARTVRPYGPRPLHGADGTVLPDATVISGLAGQSLRLHTADGGETLALTDAAGRPLWARNAQGTVSTFEYEASGSAGRPLSVSEQPDGGSSRIRERFEYASVDADTQARNQAGALTRHHDNAGRSDILGVSLTGQPLLSQERLLSADADLPDWPASEADLEDLPLTVSATHDATGAPLAQTNAAGVTTVTAYDLHGAVRETRLRYTDKAGEKDIITLSNIVRDPQGIVLSQVAGNGVTETYQYDPRTRYLTRHTFMRAGGGLISDLHYAFDPAGNILTLNEAATTTQWHRNQMTGGQRDYAYDSLYRLFSATGRERLADTARGPQVRLKADGTGSGGEWFPYSERYTYDDGDNLTEIVHTGQSGWTREITVSAISNRALLNPASDPEAGFLPGGLQRQLGDGRQLEWYADGQLRQVSPVAREGDASDTEAYRYSDGGTRVRKVSTVKASGGTQTHATTYAGGAETRRRSLNGSQQLDIVITKAGGVRVTEDRLTGDVHLRYAFTDHLNSNGGETDADGNVTSREEYYPFGGSAGTDEEAEEVNDRTYRYSGKERDATGLLYYGWRYYQPEVGRWLSADPGGLIDGVNLFRFARNNPITLIDTDGRGCSSSKIKAADAAADARNDALAAQATAVHTPVTQAVQTSTLTGKLHMESTSRWTTERTHERNSTSPASQQWKKLQNAIIPPSVGGVYSRGKEYRYEHFYDPDSQRGNSRNWKGVDYWTEEQRTENRTIVREGLLGNIRELYSNYLSDEEGNIGTAINTWRREQYGYVLGRNKSGNKSLIIFEHRVDKTHHSSPFAGGRVIDAGMMTIANGSLVYIENKSGHYMPNLPSKIHTLQFLKDQSVNIDDAFISDRSDHRMRLDLSEVYNAGEYLATNGAARSLSAAPEARNESLSMRERRKLLTFRAWNQRAWGNQAGKLIL